MGVHARYNRKTEVDLHNFLNLLAYEDCYTFISKIFIRMAYKGKSLKSYDECY